MGALDSQAAMCRFLETFVTADHFVVLICASSPVVFSEGVLNESPTFNRTMLPILSNILFGEIYFFAEGVRKLVWCVAHARKMNTFCLKSN